MTDGEQYRVKAAEFRAKAAHATSALLRRSMEMLAQVYVRLAEQADRNAENDVTYGPILPPRDSKTKAE